MFPPRGVSQVSEAEFTVLHLHGSRYAVSLCSRSTQIAALRRGPREASAHVAQVAAVAMR